MTTPWTGLVTRWTFRVSTDMTTPWTGLVTRWTFRVSTDMTITSIWFSNSVDIPCVDWYDNHHDLVCCGELIYLNTCRLRMYYVGLMINNKLHVMFVCCFVLFTSTPQSSISVYSVCVCMLAVAIYYVNDMFYVCVCVCVCACVWMYMCVCSVCVYVCAACVCAT